MSPLKQRPVRAKSTSQEESRVVERKRNRRHSGNPTIMDVARLAKCSPMTVSRVVNGDTHVKDDTRKSVMAAISQLNYSPNKAARSLAGATQMRVALLYANPSAAYLSELLMGSLDQAGRSDVTLVVGRCDYGKDEEKVVRHLIDSGVNGFLLPSPLCDELPLLDFLRKMKVRAVSIGGARAEAHHSAVMIDDYQAAYDMTSHIIGLGHKRVGFIVGNPRQSASRQRLSGYTDAMNSAGLQVHESLVKQGQFTFKSGLDAAARLLDQAERPTAIFASNDDMATATVAIAHRRGLEVPADLTVCGFDDTPIARTMWPELTTIRQPIQEMSRQALELLVKELQAERGGESHKPSHITLDCTLIRRQSDAAPSLLRTTNLKKNM
jgi:LacI family transcriptional regulator